MEEVNNEYVCRKAEQDYHAWAKSCTGTFQLLWYRWLPAINPDNNACAKRTV
jgi:hypothetical protein